MKQHEREYFVAQIRSGVYYINREELTLKVVSPTFDEHLQACHVFKEAYQEAYRKDVMCLDEIYEWMNDHELWTQEHENQIKAIQKDLERLKVEIFQNNMNDALCNKIRLYLRAGESQLEELSKQKLAYFQNTREGIAEAEKARWLIERCTFKGDELYDFAELSPDFVMSCYRDMILSQKESREIARTEPWKSIWVTHKSTGCSLFANKGNREITEDQKSVILWASMYDNIQESMDCPTDEVIQDDDMLDGWFIVQKRKRDKDRAESDFDEGTRSDKIKSAGEVFVVANSERQKERVEGMNNVAGKMIIKEREAKLKRSGKAKAGQFRDEQLQIRSQANTMYKGKFGG